MDAPEIDSTEPVPPKVVSLQARRITPEGEAGLLLSGRMSARLERRMAGDFPVLEAFQQFLELERRRARRHLVIMTSLIAVILLGVSVLGVYLGTLLHRTVTQDVTKVEAGLETIQAESSRMQNETLAQVAQVSEVTAALRSELANSAQAQTRELARYQAALADMSTKMAKLEERNDSLNHDLESVRMVMPSLTEDMGVVVNLLDELRAQPPSLAAAPASPPVRQFVAALAPAPILADPSMAVAVAAPPTPPLALALKITPPGGTTTVSWRLLIPE